MSLLARIRPEPFALLMTAAWIVGLFSAATAPLQDLWRPLVIGLVAAIVVTALAGLLRPQDRWGVIGAGCVWLVVLGAWPLALGVVLVAAWRLGIDAVRRRQGRGAVREPADRQVIRVATAVGFAAVIIAVLSLANSGAIHVGSAPAETANLPDVPDRPSIYLVLLDGYPATETLADTFGYDNGPFEQGLRDRGFDVADAPTSNYNRTLLTLTSMLYMQRIEDIGALDPPGDGFSAQTRQLTAALNEAPVLDLLNGAGYETRSIASSYGEAALTSTDVFTSSGAMTLFEEQLVRYAPVGRWAIGAAKGFVADQHRASVNGAIDELARSAATENGTRPRFVLAHVFSPHPPFVFDANGGERELLPCYPSACGLTAPEAGRLGLDVDEYGRGMVGQVQYLNGRLLYAVDHIVASDPGAVVVLFSDHGARFEEGPAPEHFRTFLAARTPGHEMLFGHWDNGLVNLMPALLNAYFDAAIPTVDNTRAWAPDTGPLELEPMP